MSTENVHKTRSYNQPMRGGMYGGFFPMMPASVQSRAEKSPWARSVEKGQGRRVDMKGRAGRQQKMILGLGHTSFELGPAGI